MAITYQGAEVAICITPQPSDMVQADYEALTYVAAGKIINAPSFAVTDTIASQNTLDTEISEKQKTISSGADSEVVVSHQPAGDAGHTALSNAAETSSYYACRMILRDALTTGGEGTTVYGRFVIGGGALGGGGSVEDFVTRTYQMGLTSQRPVEVAAT